MRWLARKLKPGSLTPEAGSWHDEAKEILAAAKTTGEIPNLKIPSSKEIYAKAIPSFSQDLIDKYLLFQKEIKIPKRVLYPSPDLDASPVRAFPNSQVVLVDINPLAVEALRRSGIEAVCSDIADYKPEQLFDLMILLNPAFVTERANHCVETGGHILSNNYHENALQMWNQPKTYEPVATIFPLREGGDRLIKEIKAEHLHNQDWAYADLFYLFRKK